MTNLRNNDGMVALAILYKNVEIRFRRVARKNDLGGSAFRITESSDILQLFARVKRKK